MGIFHIYNFDCVGVGSAQIFHAGVKCSFQGYCALLCTFVVEPKFLYYYLNYPMLRLYIRKIQNISSKTRKKVWHVFFTGVNFISEKFILVKQRCQTMLHVLKLISYVFGCISVTQGGSNDKIKIQVRSKKCTKRHIFLNMHMQICADPSPTRSEL